MLRPPLLVFGLSGQLGEALCRGGLPMPALAVSRSVIEGPATDVPGLLWRRGSLESFDDGGTFDAVLSLGPLDAFAAAVVAGRIRARRIVAFGSTSVHAKAGSPDPAERALSRRLADAEAALAGAARRAGAACVVLRPTLVWGMGRDVSLSRVVQWARRWPLLPLPVDAPGLRQPVHALDLADAARRVLLDDTVPSGAYDLPGGERLPFGRMLQRCVAVGAPVCRILPLPWRLLRALAPLDRRWAGPLGRLGVDLVFDAGPATAALGWSPRGFHPVSTDFPVDA